MNYSTGVQKINAKHSSSTSGVQSLGIGVYELNVENGVNGLCPIPNRRFLLNLRRQFTVDHDAGAEKPNTCQSLSMQLNFIFWK
jgi:hypothetical protein